MIMTTTTTKPVTTSTYEVSIRIPCFRTITIERPAGMTDEDIFNSLTLQDLWGGEDDYIPETKEFMYEKDYTLSYVEEQTDD